MPAKFNILVAAAIPLVPVIPLLACGGDSKTVDAHINVIDSPGSGSNGSNTGNCGASASYTTSPGGSDQEAFDYPASSMTLHAEEWLALMNQDANPDELDIAFVAKRTGFGSGDIKTGTYTLAAGDTMGFRTCGICAILETDLTMQGSAVVEKDDFFATGGSITLNSVGSGGSGTLSGTITNMTFGHVNIGSDGSVTPVNDGCSTTVSNVNFSAPLMAGQFDGKVRIPLVLHRRFQ
jgi:hypothetical protein